MTINGPLELFAWPHKMKKKDFYYSDSCSEHEIKRVLNNITSCSEKKWKQTFLPKLNRICPYIKDNKDMKKQIKKLISNN